MSFYTVHVYNVWQPLMWKLIYVPTWFKGMIFSPYKHKLARNWHEDKTRFHWLEVYVYSSRGMSLRLWLERNWIREGNIESKLEVHDYEERKTSKVIPLISYYVLHIMSTV